MWVSRGPPFPVGGPGPLPSPLPHQRPVGRSPGTLQVTGGASAHRAGSTGWGAAGAEVQGGWGVEPSPLPPPSRVVAEAAVRSIRQAQAEDLPCVEVDQLEKVLPQLVGAGPTPWAGAGPGGKGGCEGAVLRRLPPPRTAPGLLGCPPGRAACSPRNPAPRPQVWGFRLPASGSDEAAGPRGAPGPVPAACCCPARPPALWGTEVWHKPELCGPPLTAKLACHLRTSSCPRG